MHDVIFYAENSSMPQQVRLLLFNENFNLYRSDGNEFFAAYPIKGSSAETTGSQFIVYLANGTARLELPVADAAQIQKDIAGHNATFPKRIFKHRAIPVIMLIAATMALFYIALIALIPYLGNKMISRETEISIGRKLKNSTIAQEKVAGATIDSATTRKLNAFAKRLQLSDYPINITVLKSSSVNAYALPGGEIVVYSGILKKLDAPEALVALLAHEASHVNHRHTLRSLLKSASNAIAISVVFGDIAGVSTVLASGIQNLSELQYSRALETEADNAGMLLMNKNGLDAAGMMRLMKVFEDENKMPELPGFLSTHPLTEERIKNAESFVKRQKSAFGTRDDLTQIFTSIKAVYK